MSNIYNKLILVNKKYEKIPKKNRGIPVNTIAINKKEKITIYKSNKKLGKNNNENKHNSHAEFLIIEEIKKKHSKFKYDEWIFYITILPCQKCFEKIVNSGINIKEIYYLDNFKEDKKLGYALKISEEYYKKLKKFDFPSQEKEKEILFEWTLFLLKTYLLRTINNILNKSKKEYNYHELSSKWSEIYYLDKTISEYVYSNSKKEYKSPFKFDEKNKKIHFKQKDLEIFKKDIIKLMNNK
ncbi:MAG: hypothetical protein TYPL_4310 [Candidatus Tyloplasma litorale]|nr:MAG: hypothetical protein TYPL_4310 [Mycoplasmatales bacterium]